MHIALPPLGYDSSLAATRLAVTLHCTSAACRSGAANNGFLLAAYDSDGDPVGNFETLPPGASRRRAQRHATCFVRGFPLRRTPNGADAGAQARSAPAATR